MRPTVPFRRDFWEQTHIYLEERAYTHAFTLLQNSLAAVCSTQSCEPAPIPSPHTLGLIATLAIHPRTTTRAQSQDAHDASQSALQYLFNLIEITGVRNANLHRAFAFQGVAGIDAAASTKRKLNRRQVIKREADEAVQSPMSPLNEPDPWDEAGVNDALADRNSVFRRVEDFWAVVGWAFNCAVRHRHRWIYFEKWLQLMLEILESDANDCASHSDDNHLRSVATMYLEKQAAAGPTAWRRVARAIFADGSDSSVQEFEEIWKAEAKELVTEESKDLQRQKDKRALDLDDGLFGDYQDEGDDSGDEAGPDASGAIATRPRKKRKSAGRKSLQGGDNGIAGDCASIESQGGHAVFSIRRRLVAVICETLHTATQPSIQPSEFLEIIAAHIMQQPLDLFLLWISPHQPCVDTDLVYSLDGDLGILRHKLLVSLLPSRAMSALGKKPGHISQSTLRDSLLPSTPASGQTRDSAKLSLLLESLLQAAWAKAPLENMPKLRASVEQGIEARQARATKGKSQRAVEQAWLEDSAKRLRLILDAAQGS